MFSIISDLLGSNFTIKENYTYTTRLVKVINKTSPIRIMFDSSSVFPVKVYFRRLMQNEQEVDLAFPMSIYNVTNNGDVIDITLEKNIVTLIIFEFMRINIMDRVKFEIFFKNSNCKTIPLMYMYETRSGLPYYVHKLGSYSEYEFNYKTGLYTVPNSYVGKTIASEPLVGHIHENERGFIDRAYTVSKYNKLHGKKLYRDKFLDEREKKETEFVYLNNGEQHQTVVEQSDKVIKGVLFQTEDHFLKERLPRPIPRILISGRVWIENLPLDGILSNEEFAKDVKVILYDISNNIIDTQITQDNGFYTFDVPDEGEYYVEFDYSLIKELKKIKGFTLKDMDVRQKSSHVNPNSGKSDILYLMDNSKAIVNAGLKPTAHTEVKGTVWIDDIPANNIFDGNEFTPSNIKVILRSVTHEEIDSTLTDNNGYYSITGFDIGDYYLVFNYSNAEMSTKIVGFTQKDQDTIENSSSVNPLSGTTDIFTIYNNDIIIKNCGLIIKDDEDDKTGDGDEPGTDDNDDDDDKDKDKEDEDGEGTGVGTSTSSVIMLAYVLKDTIPSNTIIRYIDLGIISPTGDKQGTIVLASDMKEAANVYIPNTIRKTIDYGKAIYESYSFYQANIPVTTGMDDRYGFLNNARDLSVVYIKGKLENELYLSIFTDQSKYADPTDEWAYTTQEQAKNIKVKIEIYENTNVDLLEDYKTMDKNKLGSLVDETTINLKDLIEKYHLKQAEGTIDHSYNQGKFTSEDINTNPDKGTNVSVTSKFLYKLKWNNKYEIEPCY